MTDKELQTCYVVSRIDSDLKVIDTQTGKYKDCVNRSRKVYIHTPEELEALKAKWEREAAEKACNYVLANVKLEFKPLLVVDTAVDLTIDIEEYLNKNHPIK